MSDIRTLWLSSLGGAREFYDFIIFVFFTAVIDKLFFLSYLPDWLRQLQTHGIFAVGYQARPGWHRDGSLRRHIWPERVFTLSGLLMPIPTILARFEPGTPGAPFLCDHLLHVSQTYRKLPIIESAEQKCSRCCCHVWLSHRAFSN